MHKEDRLRSNPSTAIWHEIAAICAVLMREFDDGVLTVPELAEVVHDQVCELARVYHQLVQLQSRREGEN